MALQLAHLERIPHGLHEPVGRYAERLAELAGKLLEGLTLYGPVAFETFDPDLHVVHSAVVLGRIELELLRELAAEGKHLGAERFAAPVVMTPDYIEDSRDTFPLELLEIQHTEVTVIGPDRFAELEFAENDVRHQCEREIKALLFGLRQGLLAAGGHDQLLGTLEQNAAETLLRTLRGMLWLEGSRELHLTPEVLAEAERSLGREFRGIRAVLDATGAGGWEQFEALYADLDFLREKIDAW